MSSPSASRAAAARSALGQATEYRQGARYPYPSLELRVFATALGVRLTAVLWPAGVIGMRKPQTLAEAVWQPAEVTELLIVEWGERALRAWLEDQMLTDIDGQVEA